MKFRSNILPRSLPDILATGVIAVCVPLTFWFELFVVVPEFHSPGSLLYNLTFVAATFLLINVKANMLAVMIYNTSIKGRVLTPPADVDMKKLWRYCETCETLAPPRSWHCQTCKTCILKRDHHCLFTGCCVGHHNHRFFMMFVLFMFVGSTYASIYNSIWIWHNHSEIFANWFTVLKMAMPLLMFTIDMSVSNGYLIIYELNLIAVAITGMLLIYHGRIVLDGSVVHERKLRIYDLGWRENLKMVFGERWKIAWILPFIESQLPHDGIHWESIVFDSDKTR